MPTNLPPQYFEAEKVYRQARTVQDKIEALENMLAIMPKHKGTDHLKGELRARIARLNEEAARRPSGGRPQFGYVRKEGAGQVLLLGMTNSGKSNLLASITEASPKTGAYPFTTQAPLPAMMPYENVLVQIVDLPSVIPEGVPPWMRALIRQSDLLLIVVDLVADPLEEAETVLGELRAMRVEPATLRVDGAEAEVPRIWKRILLLANKLDLPEADENLEILRLEYEDRLPVVAVSSETGTGLEDLRRKVFEALDVIRIYTRPPGKQPDYTRPVVLPKGSTVEDLAADIHKDIKQKLKYSLLWGSGKFSGQRVSRTYTLEDGDVVELCF